MNIEYDKYYQIKNLFGAPYLELINFYSSIVGFILVKRKKK